MDDKPISIAVSVVGSQAALATILDVPAALVWQWVNDRRPVAARHCIPIEAATGGRVTRYDLRPDVFGGSPSTPKHGKQKAA